MEWFRLYGEFATDPKVQMLSEALQRRLVMLFCLECSNGIETFHVAAEATSTFDLKTAKPDDKSLRQRFERNYAIVVRRAQNGQPLNGCIAEGICHDSSRSPQQKQLEYSHQEAMRVVATLGIPADPKSARAQLLASLGIRRDKHV